MATSGASEGRLWMRGWCLRTRSLREQINTAAPCTWTFLPLCRLVLSPFLSVLIYPLTLSRSFSLPFSFSDPYYALPPPRVTRNSRSFLSTHIHRVFHQYLLVQPSIPLSFSSESPSASYPARAVDTHPRFHPDIHDSRWLYFPSTLRKESSSRGLACSSST